MCIFGIPTRMCFVTMICYQVLSMSDDNFHFGVFVLSVGFNQSYSATVTSPTFKGWDTSIGEKELYSKNSQPTSKFQRQTYLTHQ